MRMGFAGRDGSCNIVKKVSSSSSTSKGTKNNAVGRREDELYRRRSHGRRNASIRLQIDKIGPICKPRKKAAAVFPETEAEEDGDLDKQFWKEGWLDDDKSMWLSLNCTSPSSPCDDNKLFDSRHLYIDEWLVSWLSIPKKPHSFLDKGIAFFDKSMLNPVEEASLVLEKTILNAERNLEEDLRKGEVVTWLLSSTGNDAIDSSVTCSESAESSHTQSCEDFTGSDNSLTSSSTHLDSSSQIWDLDSADCLVSLVNLDGEDFKWISDAESELDYFRSGFPSPSFNSSWNSEIQSSISSVSSLTEVEHEKSQQVLSYEHVSDAAELDVLDSNEPLFWPFEQKFDWNSELTYFCMSPRRDRDKVRTSETTMFTASIRSKSHNRNADLKVGCKTNLVIGSGPTASKIPECRRQSKNKGVTKIKAMPSRFSKQTENSVKILPLEMKDDIVEPTVGAVSTKKLVEKDMNFLKEDLALHEELPIESLLGLDEFDGHEGIDSEFNRDDFYLDKSL